MVNSFRNIIHIHIPAFAIAVERVCRPELRDRPVAIVPPHSDRALILAVSAEARKEGIFKGMPAGKARRFCPDLTIIPPDPELMQRASGVLAKAVSRYTPIWELFRPGHVYLDVTGTERLWGRAKDTADRLRREIKERLRLRGSVGVSGNKMVSSIASRILPSEGTLDVDHGRESVFMAPLKVDLLPGIGPVRRRILLEELNIVRVREIAAMDEVGLRLVFGRQAFVIHQRALGIDPTPVYPPQAKPAVAEEIVLPGDENDDRVLIGILYGLVERCARRLRCRSLHPQWAGLTIRYADHAEMVRRIKLPCTSFWDFDLYRPLERLFFKMYSRRIRIKFIKVWFQDFSPPSPQLFLFPATPPENAKEHGIIRALDRIRKKHGETSIRYGRGISEVADPGGGCA